MKPNPRKSSARSLARRADPKPDSTIPEVFPIVGIGASAGGLEAFTQLLKHLPSETGMAFVVVQHLAPQHESMLAELLGRATPMQVSEVRDGMNVQPDHIYVIPPNTNMGVRNGTLQLVPRKGDGVKHMPINHFFISLAEHRKSRAVGVILSGTASDGTLGLKAIKAEGGITFAQDEKSARYDSMPHSAIVSGYVDFVLPPEQIARELARIGHHPYVASPKPPEAEEAEETGSPEERGLHRVLLLLRSFTGDDFTHYKKNTIRRRIKRRMVLHNIQSIAQYERLLLDNKAEKEALYNDILINVTGFFRTPETFVALKKKVFPKLVKKRSSGQPVRVWVPGCSTGEEAYSIAIAWTEFTGSRKNSVPLQVFGTDINESWIERARSAKYGESISADVTPERLRRFFVPTAGGYQVSKTIRDMCIFARQNLIKDPPFSRMDLISCRNLLIYLDTVLQRNVVPVLHYALKPGGFLMLGTSETLSHFPDLLTSVDKKTKIFCKTTTSAARPMLGLGPLVELARRAETGKHGPAQLSPTFDTDKEAERILLHRYTPPAVVINSALEIVRFHGRTGPYLEPAPGEASLSLPRMAREGLPIEIRTAVHRARRTDRPVMKEGLRLRHNGQMREVTLEVVPLPSSKSADPHFLVLFREQTPAERARVTGRAVKGEKARASDSVAAGLRRDLEETRGQLQSIIESQEASNEELRSANEEILSSNEELQSTNEELETAKEELQSTNEELTTLNEELQNRNNELNALNSDLNNFFNNVPVPVLMLSSDLRIRRISPAAEKLLHVIPTDVGRPITDLKTGIDFEELQPIVTEAIEQVTAQSKEVQDQTGRWYSVRVRPYRTIENKIDGAVLTIVDLSPAEAPVYAQPASEPVVVLDPNLQVRDASSAFYEMFRVTHEDVVGRHFYSLGNGQWNIPALRVQLEKTLTDNFEMRDFEVSQKFPAIGEKTLKLSARRAQLIYLSFAEAKTPAGGRDGGSAAQSISAQSGPGPAAK
jgi:two-component system CheB/CheR fusion protein